MTTRMVVAIAPNGIVHDIAVSKEFDGDLRTFCGYDIEDDWRYKVVQDGEEVTDTPCVVCLTRARYA